MFNIFYIQLLNCKIKEINNLWSTNYQNALDSKTIQPLKYLLNMFCVFYIIGTT